MSMPKPEASTLADTLGLHALHQHTDSGEPSFSPAPIKQPSPKDDVVGGPIFS